MPPRLGDDLAIIFKVGLESAADEGTDLLDEEVPCCAVVSGGASAVAT